MIIIIRHPLFQPFKDILFIVCLRIEHMCSTVRVTLLSFSVAFSPSLSHSHSLSRSIIIVFVVTTIVFKWSLFSNYLFRVQCNFRKEEDDCSHIRITYQNVKRKKFPISDKMVRNHSRNFSFDCGLFVFFSAFSSDSLFIPFFVLFSMPLVFLFFFSVFCSAALLLFLSLI